jgi:BTB/POZ domain
MANPHPNPIIIMAQDMNAKLVGNLLEFIYVGAVNVEQAELSAFMKIAEVLQIKGLTTNSKDNNSSNQTSEQKQGFENIFERARKKLYIVFSF